MKRDAYGVAVGFDTPVASGVRVGLAGGFSSGNTKNDSVGVKDEFDASLREYIQSEEYVSAKQQKRY